MKTEAGKADDFLCEHLTEANCKGPDKAGPYAISDVPRLFGFVVFSQCCYLTLWYIVSPF